MVEYNNFPAKELLLKLCKIDALLLWKDIINGNLKKNHFASNLKTQITLWLQVFIQIKIK